MATQLLETAIQEFHQNEIAQIRAMHGKVYGKTVGNRRTL